MTQKTPIVWCVGGSDSSAHAGLQADLRTGQDLNCHVQTIVTCITAQNSQCVSSVEAVTVKMFNDQWQTLLNDAVPDAIKVSLLPNTELLLACAAWLKKIKETLAEVSIIFDPVMAASSEEGNRLQQSEVAELLLDNLLPYIDVITPNAMEFTTLTGLQASQNGDSLQQQLAPWFERANCSWLIKGGHCDAESCVDWFIWPSQAYGFASRRVHVKNNRGTGCTLSTALASFIAHGYDLLDAFTLAKAYLNGAIISGIKIGGGAGPLGQPGWPTCVDHVPTVLEKDNTHVALPDHFPQIPATELGLYPVMDSVEWLERVLKNGVTTVQLRIKKPDGLLSDNIKKAVALGRHYGARVFINDYWQLAIEHGAYGIHLGQEDLVTADLNAIHAAGLALGISTHGYFEIAKALAVKPSYIALGHIFPTKTKDMPSKPQGLERLSRYVALLKGHFPTVAIGGIHAERVEPVLATGVDSVALVSAIQQAQNPDNVTETLSALVRTKQREEAK